MSRPITTALASAAAGAALVLAFVAGTHNAVPAPDVVIPASSPADVAPAVVADDPAAEPTVAAEPSRRPSTDDTTTPAVVKTSPRARDTSPAAVDDTSAQEAADRAEAAAKRAEKAADKAETETKPTPEPINPKLGTDGSTGLPAGGTGPGNGAGEGAPKKCALHSLCPEQLG